MTSPFVLYVSGLKFHGAFLCVRARVPVLHVVDLYNAQVVFSCILRARFLIK